jgi:multidrug efflux pump subunit AcrA (membrane-fusion protein)
MELKMRNRTSFIAIIVLLISALTACNKADNAGFKIVKGDFVQSVTEAGELAAVNAENFVLQRYGRFWHEMKIIGLLPHGSEVQAGDSLFQLDPSDVKKYIIDRETDLENQLANLEKTVVQNENRRSDLHSALLSEQASFNLKKLELEQFRFESEKSRRIKELEFQQASINLAKIKRRIELNEIIARNDLIIQELRVNRVKNDVESAYAILPKLTVRTPIPGIFQVAKKRRSNDLIQVGSSIYFGTLVGSVPDLRWMKVHSRINETDFMKMSVGQKVNVRLDALPEVIFNGEISFISKLCHPIDDNARQKVFDVEVKMRVSDHRLKPGMTVSCEYLCAELKNVLYVPLSCLETNGSKHTLYVDNGNKIEKREVLTGPSNNSFVVVSGNIEPGLKIIPVKDVTNK